ncbi:MAG: cyclic nucleotide-binding domain-containing protein [Verrucomicrobiota bacterium]|nr:cyclic nucleotide-binding domain-containing protein [Verrucomicrobiota bacterium]
MKTEPAPPHDQVKIPKVLEPIREHPFLHGLSQEHLEIIADCAMATKFAAGEQIFREGDPANRFYLIKSGRIILERTGNEGVVKTIQIIGPQDVLGWSWLYPPFYWHFDARALEETEAVFLYGTRIREFCEQNHDLGYEVMKRIAHVLINRLLAARRDLASEEI